MRITCISDTHDQHHRINLDEGDLLLFAGDGTSKDFVEWLNIQPFQYKVCTFGNHDFNYHEILDYSKVFHGIYFLINEHITIEGLKIYGSPYSLPFFDWTFMQPEEVLKQYYSEIEDDTNILITHCPPYKILDQTWKGIHAGSISLAERSKQLPDLKLHVFGHIHEAQGVMDKYVNASVLNKNYKYNHRIIKVNL